jgi:hypothetical protein
MLERLASPTIIPTKPIPESSTPKKRKRTPRKTPPQDVNVAKGKQEESSESSSSSAEEDEQIGSDPEMFIFHGAAKPEVYVFWSWLQSLQDNYSRERNTLPGKVIRKQELKLIAQKQDLTKDWTSVLGQVLQWARNNLDNFLPSDLQNINLIYQFLDFYQNTGKSGASCLNRAKYLQIVFQELLKTQPLPDGFERNTLVVTCARLRTQISRFRKIKEQEHARRQSEVHQEKKGKWLTLPQLVEVNASLVETLVELKQSLRGKLAGKKFVAINQKDIREYQKNMLALCSIQGLGIRKEVLYQMDLGNFTINNNNKELTLSPYSEKKIRRNEAVGFGETCIELFQFWLKLRKATLIHLKKERVEAIWISVKGTPKSPKEISQGIKEAVAKVFPGKNIGPAVLRRVIVSHAKTVIEAGKMSSFTVDESMNQLALTLNTSTEVMDSSYDRRDNEAKRAKFEKELRKKLRLEKSNSSSEEEEFPVPDYDGTSKSQLIVLLGQQEQKYTQLKKKFRHLLKKYKKLKKIQDKEESESELDSDD